MTVLCLLARLAPAATFSAAEYAYPLQQGIRWQYAVAGFGTVTREIRGTATHFAGRPSVGLVTSANGTTLTTYWVSVDNGFQVHRADYPLEEAAIFLGSPLTYLPASFDLGQTYNFSAPSGIGSLGGAAPALSDVSTVVLTVEAEERVTVPAGAFDTVRVRLVEDGSTTQRWWLARGIGIVKLSSSVDGEWELSSTTVTPVASPLITRQPTSQSAAQGGTVTLSVEATGGAPLSYQWRKGNADLAGQTGPSLTLGPLTPSDAGTYQVLVTSGGSSTLSAAATLTVTAAPPPATPPRFTSIRPAALAGSLDLRFTATPGRSFQLESSTDLKSWSETQAVDAAGAESVVTLERRAGDIARFFRLREGTSGAGQLLTMPTPGQLYPEGTRLGGSLFGIEFAIPTEWKGGLRVNTPHLLFGSDTQPGAILGMIGFAGTRAELNADPSLKQGFESDAGASGTVRFQPSTALQEVGTDQMRVEFTGFDQAGQGYWMGVHFVLHPDGGFLLLVGITSTAKAGELRPQVERFAATTKTTRRATNNNLVNALHGRSFQWAGDSRDWYNGNLNGSASLSSWSEKFAFFCANGTIEINTKSTGYASTRQSGGWSSTYMSLSYDSSTTEYGQFAVVTDPQYGDVLLLATLKGYQVAPVRILGDGQLLVGDQRLAPHGVFQCAAP
ncbi:MAG: immunoglobulin domain-containing protein [Verrucomicrobiales bacterium]|nr:immunoglobulin domain-containing protein [Verrucomicrobiales bacterium]